MRRDAEIRTRWLRKYCSAVHHYDQLGALARDMRSEGKVDAADDAEDMQALYGLLSNVAAARLQKHPKRED